MTKIIADSSTLFSIEEGAQKNVAITPIVVTINNKTYREYEEITDVEFINLINQGHIPTSSQPAIGEVVEVLEANQDQDCLILSITDGLSGAYGSAVSASTMVNDPSKIKVLNTKTLCGPHRYVTEIAATMATNGKSIEDIIYTVKQHLEGSISFLLPSDFGYLKRGGRLTPLSATLGGILKIQPIVILTQDGKRLDKFAVARSFDIGISKIIAHLKAANINENHIIYLSHAFAQEKIERTLLKFKESFHNTEIRLLNLSCAFITQGGPGCIAIQTVIK